MGARGRKSSADLAVIGPAGIVTMRRPPAPRELTDEESEVWRSIVGSEPAEQFSRGAQGTLVQLCRHIVRGRRLAQLANEMEGSDSFDLKEYLAIQRAEAANSGVIKTCETALRRTPQTRYDREKKRTSLKPPWEEG